MDPLDGGGVWVILGTFKGHAGISFLHRSNLFVSYHPDSGFTGRPRSWKTKGGVDRFIAREKKMGSLWSYYPYRVRVAGQGAGGVW